MVIDRATAFVPLGLVRNKQKVQAGVTEALSKFMSASSHLRKKENKGLRARSRKRKLVT